MSARFEVGRGRAIPSAGSKGEMRVITVPTGDERPAADRLRRLCAEATLAKKADRAAELLERVAARGRAERLEGPDTTLGPSTDQLAEQWRRSYEARAAQMCAESEAAYAARNPHKREGQR